MWLVIGLGNPGARYAETRHNAGFEVVARLAQRWSIPTTRQHAGAEYGKGTFHSHPVVLARPLQYMNRSGPPSQALRDWFGVPPHQVVVIHDDMDLPFGQVRVKQGGGHGGHNGLRDLNQHLGPDYCRVRVGLSRPPTGWDPVDYVLARWTSTEQDQLGEFLDHASDTVELVITGGPVSAMNKVNVRPRSVRRDNIINQEQERGDPGPALSSAGHGQATAAVAEPTPPLHDRKMRS